MSKEKSVPQVTAIRVAVDDGSGNIAHKFKDDRGQVFEQVSPSCIVEGVLSDLTNGISEQAWETDEGQRYTVTINHTSQINTCNKNYQVSLANRVLVQNAIAKGGLAGQQVHLGVTLPTAQFYTGDPEKPIAVERIEEKCANIKKGVTNISGAYAKADIVDVTVYPEAIPAYIYCSLNEDGTPASDYPDDHLTLVVDLGRYTCDMALITTGYQVNKFATTENGVHLMCDRFRKFLARNASSINLMDVDSFSDNQIDRIINLGYIGSSLESEKAIAARKDVTHLIKDAKEYLADIIFKDIRAIAGDINTLTRIVFVGGGANWLAEEAQEWCHTVSIPAEPELAIVRGTYFMLTQEA
ncbi:ParM/StbA family protein [Vibrio parahaemolyticus]|nr:ParM/StbA family protein [Vibrio parahaemolyticus]